MSKKENIDIEKSEYEQAYQDNQDSNVCEGEAFEAVCILDVPATSITTNEVYTCQCLENGDIVVDSAIQMPADIFWAHFDVEDELDAEDGEVAIENDIPSNLSAEEMFEYLIMSVNRPGTEELLEYCRNSDFYYAPASSQYHGSYAGGLVDHSLSVYDNMLNLYTFIKQLYPNVPDISRESFIIAALLHDFCKINTYVPGTRNVKNEETGQWEKVDIYKREPKFAMGHAGKSIFIVQQFMQLTPQEAQAIFWHMGAYDTSTYNTWNELSQAYNGNLLAFILHQADMMATYITENENYA